MTENEINITDMIKALQCVASQDAEGDCYCDHFNAHLTCEQFGDNTRLDEKHMSCGGILKDTQSCPYSQKTYGVSFEDGELWWLKDIVSILTEIQQYQAIGTVEEIEKSMQNVSVLLAEHELLKLYQSIGTIDEFKALKENSFFNFDSPVARVDEKSYNKAIDDVFDFFKTQRDKKSMKVNFDDLEIRKYKEQLKGE